MRATWLSTAAISTAQRDTGGADSYGTVFEYQIVGQTGTVTYGQSATYTATVSSAAGVPPDGSVQFLVNGVAYGSPVALSGATAQLVISEPAGSYTIAAQYTGDANYAVTLPAAETTSSLTVNPGGSQTSLKSSENPSNYGDSVTFTAMVSPTSSASGLATPTGQVEFFDGSTLLDTENLSAGSASYTTSSLPLGANQQIEAKYLGDTNYNPSNVTIPQTVNPPPLTDYWTGASAAHGGNDNWSNPGNWALGAPPTTLETAYFTASVSQYAASNVDTSFSIANLTIDSTWGGSVVASQPLTISGNLILASGTLGGSAAVSVAGSGSQFSGGTLGGNLSNAGTLEISGNVEYLGGTLTNTGTIDVTGSGVVYAYAPNATINNQTGAVFDFQSSASLANNYSYANPTFNNAGTLEMTAGSGTATVGFALNESGATSALGNSSSGTLSLSDGGSFGGTATVSGAVTLANGTFTVADGTTITPPSGGSGSLQVAGGTLSLAGSLTTTVLAIDGGTLAGTGTIAAGSQVTWSGGTLAGAVTSAGTLEISGNVEYLGGTLTNTGTIDVTGSGVVYAYAPNATINNQTGAVFDFQSSALTGQQLQLRQSDLQ